MDWYSSIQILIEKAHNNYDRTKEHIYLSTGQASKRPEDTANNSE